MNLNEITIMKKAYITPAIELEALATTSIIAGSLTITGDTGTATFFDENAQSDALIKGVFFDFGI